MGTKGKLKWLVVCVISLTLIGCGGSGDDGAVTPRVLSLTGTVTDTNLAPVAGATVRVNNGTPVTTNAAGRYNLYDLAGNTPLRLSYAGPAAEFFPAAATVTLTAGKTTVLDLFLVRATGQTVNADTGGAITSQVHLDPSGNAVFNLAADELLAGGVAYAGTATAYLAPVDVGKPGHGLANYQAGLGTFFRALAADAAILETYGSAGLNLTDGAGAALSLIATPTSTLTIPIPASPAELRTTAPATTPLWYLDTTTGAWLASGATATKDISGESYTGIVSRPGLWRAAVELTQSAGKLTEITGTLLFNNGAPAAGATIYLNGTDHGFQNISTTSDTGAFALPAKTNGDFCLNFVVYANGAQWPHRQTITNLGAGNATLGNVILPYAPPVAGAATATITIDSRPTGPIGPNTLGYLPAAGRQISGDDDLLAARNIADVTFLANETTTFGAVTLTPTQAGAGIQQVAATFAGLTTAPAAGYFTSADQPAQYTIADLETATLPVLVVVKTAQGHYAKISIDSVTSFYGAWRVTFRHAFSLSGNF